MQLYKGVKQGSTIWKLLRKQACDFTSTSVPTIMGINPYESRTAFVRRLQKGEEKKFDEFAQQAMAHGQEREAEAFKVLNEEFLVPDYIGTYSPGLYTWKEDRRIGASPDAVFSNAQTKKEMGCVEIKCPFTGSWWHSFDPVQIFEKKPQYYIQAQLQLACTDTHTCLFFIYCVNSEDDACYVLIQITRDDELLKYILDHCNKWREILMAEEIPVSVLRCTGDERREHFNQLGSSVVNHTRLVANGIVKKPEETN